MSGDFVFAIPDTFIAARCPSAYQQLQAVRTTGFLSPENIARYRNSVLLSMLAGATISHLVSECEREAQAKVSSVFFKVIGEFLSTTGEAFMGLSAVFGGGASRNRTFGSSIRNLLK